MRTRGSKILVTLCVTSVLLVAIGCGRPLGGNPKPSRFYVLTPVTTAPASKGDSTGKREPTVGVTLAEIPDHLRREEIVTRPSENRVSPADLDRWAGKLDDNISNVVATNLSNMIPSERVVVLPSSRAVPLTYRVHVDIAAFEQGPSGVVDLTAVWQVFRGDGTRMIEMRRADISTTPGGSGYDAIVAAMSQALGELSRQIADAIRG